MFALKGEIYFNILWLTYFYNFLYKNEPQCINFGNQNAKESLHFNFVGVILLWPVLFARFFICVCCEDLRVMYLVVLGAELLQVSTLTLH